jgi:acetyltransferase
MRSLEAVFHPRSVAVIGASERPNSVGHSVLWNLTAHPFGGVVYPVNPKHHELLGLACYARIGDVPAQVDLAVIATPAPSVPEIVGACGAAGVKAAIVLSAGFRETGAEGLRLEQQLRAQAAISGMRIVGPNCLGVMSPLSGLNATFANVVAQPGSVAFVSQSGALGTAVLDWSVAQNVGFSQFVSVGSMLDVGWSDLIEYLGDDPETKSIVLYMESIGEPAAFLSAARTVAGAKPIVVLKAGRTLAAAKAAASHTGALTGNDDVYDAVFERSGVLRVTSIEDLFSVADALGKQPRPRGRRLTIVTNAGGAGVLATDALIEGGGDLTTISPATVAALNELLPAHWSQQNPIDVLGDADAERYGRALEIATSDPGGDAVLAIFAPQAIADAKQVAERVRAVARASAKTMLACWMGGADVAAGATLLEQAGIPSFAYPDAAARTFNALWRYDANLQALYETPTPQVGPVPERSTVRAAIDAALAAGRTLLSESESKALLAAYGIPVLPAVSAASAGDAVAAAHRIGYPVAVKLHSLTVTHKSEVGGVRLNVTSDDEVARAFNEIAEATTAAAGAHAFSGVVVEPMAPTGGYELIVGSSVEPGFGPVVLFGLGGVLVEILRDRAFALPPLTTTLAKRLMEGTRIFSAFRGVRGRPPVDVAALAQVLVRFADLVVEQPRIREIEINPLVAAGGQLVAVDARVVLVDATIADDALPRSAIRPYPVEYAGAWTARDGERFTLRPIRPDDEPLVQRFLGGLSERSIYLRFARALRTDRIDHRRLARLCFIDYRREMALVALRDGSAGTELVAVGRLIREREANEGEFALLVADPLQGHGLGTELLQRLIQIGRAEGLARIVGFVLGENQAMLEVCAALGFHMERSVGDAMVNVRLDLTPAAAEVIRS